MYILLVFIVLGSPLKATQVSLEFQEFQSEKTCFDAGELAKSLETLSTKIIYHCVKK